MINSNTSCTKCVDGINTCVYSAGKLVRNEFSRSRKQRYKCKDSNKTIVENYTYKACFGNVNKQIVILLTEGVGIRSIARVLQISATTLLKRIIAISDRISLPANHSGSKRHWYKIG